jgi:DNA primase
MADVEDILTEIGIHVASRSRSQFDGHVELAACCPRHYEGTRIDHSPSWTINADTGSHKCHGCGFGGSLEWLIQVVTGVDRAEAVKVSARGERALTRLRTADPWDGERPAQVRPMTNARVRAYADPPAEALAKRKISAEDATAFGIRWDTNKQAWVLPIIDPATGDPLGIQVKGEGNRHFRNLPTGVEKSRTLFGIERLGEGRCVLVESPLDAALVHSYGYQGISSFGAEVSTAQMDLIVARCDELLLFLDNDAAGRKATMRLLGRRTDGKRVGYFPDYSARIPTWIADYSNVTAKDVGDMTRAQAQRILRDPVSALKLTMQRISA